MQGRGFSRCSLNFCAAIISAMHCATPSPGSTFFVSTIVTRGARSADCSGSRERRKSQNPESPRLEGHYLLINKTLIEVIALFALAFIPTGRWGGLDGFIRLMCCSRPKTANDPPKSESQQQQQQQPAST